jgi:hypothetical protein
MPRACTASDCGTVSDGCGGVLNCGVCARDAGGPG